MARDAGRRATTDVEVFARLYPELRRFAAVVASSDIDPDDLLQDALTSVLASGDLGRLQDPAAYIRRAILNRESNHRRSQARRRARSHLIEIEDSEAAVYPSDLADLEALHPHERAVLFLHEVEGWRFGQIAELLELPESSIRRDASAARQRLRATLSKETGA